MPLPAILGALARGATAVGKATGFGKNVTGVTSALSGSGSVGEKAAVVGKNLKPIADSLTQLTFNAQILGQGLKSLTGTFGSLTSAVGHAAILPLNLFTKGIDALNAPVLAVVGSLKHFRDSVGAIGSAVSEFVQLASPIHVVRFNLAMQDLTASIGKILIPVLDASTVVVRAFADVIFRLSSPLQNLVKVILDPFVKEVPQLLTILTPIIDLIGTFVNILATGLQPVMKLLVPLLEGMTVAFAAIVAPAVIPAVIGVVAALAGVFATLLVVMSPVIALFAAIGYAFQKLTTYLAKLLGITSLGGGSVGAAVRPATIGSVEEYGRKAQQAAFSLGTAADPATRTANGIDELIKLVQSRVDEVMRVLDNLPQKAYELFKTLFQESPAGKAAAAATEAGRWIDEKKNAVENRAKMLASGSFSDFLDSLNPL